jgi:hypothetical protein
MNENSKEMLMIPRFSHFYKNVKIIQQKYCMLLVLSNFIL